ncbi:MAG: F0F1 ATP synthase subunit B [bacterium]|nr:F0F1 ATP synthase subunit B [bacterium]MDZ4299610.1 F0F1 ATP synthase subunit B [Candidatus Sungbacteria bacterium]
MAELLKNFGVEWKVLLAQAVNFFILFFLLKKFAYRPILDMLRRRKSEIERGLAMRDEAAENLAKTKVMEEEAAERANKNALAVVSDAEETARRRKDEIATEAVKKSEQIVEEARRIIREERGKMAEEVERDAEALVYAGLTRVLGVLPPEIRDRELIREALRELKTIES